MNDDKLPELDVPDGPDWPFEPRRPEDIGDFMNGVGALVKAARAVVNVGFPSHDCEHAPTIEALEAALKPFEGP